MHDLGALVYLMVPIIIGALIGTALALIGTALTHAIAGRLHASSWREYEADSAWGPPKRG